ncbi:MAG: peptidase S8 and S53 subtilisin kexin sedolisin [Betaproteobacteria bacterium]|nr:peptidase S8 and S53 subtilisin kexin sedolisin [Betaproteobacteria bacterium]
MTLHIGVVDSGHAPEQARWIVAGRRFSLSETGVSEGRLSEDALGHGGAVLQAIVSRAPDVHISLAQVFDGRGVTSPLQIAAALEWLRGRGVRLINLSLGLHRDSRLVRAACAELLDDGALICASSPARGAPVFPASLPGVVRVTGDARCGAREWSWLDSSQADFGAAVDAGSPGVAGASLGCAAFSGHLAALLAERPDLSNDGLLRWMCDNARYRGIERKAI